jgi:hypothetical protein
MATLNGRRVRRVLLALGLVGTLASAWVGVGPSGVTTYQSASVNNYCESMIAGHPSPPTNDNAAAYHAWAKKNLKFFQHLQSEAKSATAKSYLRVLVPILKVEAKSTNMKTLSGYIANQQLTWAHEWVEFDESVVVCAKWAINLL